jgi:peptidyl carrier protein
MTIEQDITAYVADAWLGGDTQDLTAEVSLTDMNIIDSAAMFDLVHYLQTRFRISVPLTEVTPANFATIKTIAMLVERLHGAEAVR